MKYLLIDTNIYLNMFVARDKSHKAESYSYLMKLLDYGEIRLVIPKIVMTEVFRHLNSEINKVGVEISTIKSKVNSLNWINQADELEKFKDKLRPVKDGINDLNDEFDRNKEKYKEESRELVNKLFQHGNSVIIDETEDIVFKATQRKVHKKRPFHYNGKDKEKDSMADSIIIETLINIEDLMSFGDSDTIYFISRNPADFSAESDKNVLHEHIKSSIELKGLDNRIYYRLMFTKTLSEDFEDEIENVDLTQELEEEAKYEEEMAVQDFIDNNRAAGGLTSLTADYECIISELDCITNLLYLFEEIKDEILNKYEKYSEIYYFLDKELGKRNFEELITLVANYNGQNPLLELDIKKNNDEGEIKDEIWWLVHFLCLDLEELDVYEIIEYQDHFTLNTTLITIRDIMGVKYRLDINGYLNPTNDHEDTIYFEVYRDTIKITEGRIEIYYGYLNFNDEGNADDGAAESIDVHIEQVIDELISIKERIINEFDEKIKILLKIIEKLGIEYENEEDKG